MEREDNRRTHRVLAVFAHPDDESYGPGATLARLGAEGCEVRLITLTRGESASMGDSPLFSPEFLAETRVMELECACIALGISNHELLDFPDKALVSVPPDELAEPVIRTLLDFRPHVVITFHPSGISGHPDHQSATRAVRRALEIIQASGNKPRDAFAEEPVRWSKAKAMEPPGDQPSGSPGDQASGSSKDRASGFSSDRALPSSIIQNEGPLKDQPEESPGDHAERSSVDRLVHPRLAYYVVPESVAAKIKWRTLHTVPDDDVTHAIEIGEYLESKIEAVHCHKTQRYLFEKLSEFPGGIEALWKYEYFIVKGYRSGGSPSTSLIAAI